MKALIAMLLLCLFTATVFAQNYDFPSNPTLDQIVTGPGGQQFKWDGVKWVAMLAAGGGGGGLVFVGAIPPPSPPVGQLWYDPTNLQTYLWYNDGTSSQWVAIVNIAGGGGNFLPINNPTYTGLMTGPSILLTTEASTGNAIYMGTSTTAPFATLLATTGNGGRSQIDVTAGAHLVNGVGWQADSVAATITQWAGGDPATSSPAAINMYVNEGLTIGNTFTPDLVAQFTSAGFGVGQFVPSDAGAPAGGSPVIYESGLFNSSMAYNSFDAGLYLTPTGFKVSDPNGTVFHHYMDGTATAGPALHEVAWIMAHGLTQGSIWDGVTARSQYLALRDDALGGTPGLWLDKGYYWAGGVPQGAVQSWTPTVLFGGTADTTAVIYYAHYTKVGNNVQVDFGIGNINGGAPGSAQICGLPYAIIAGTNQGMWPLINFGGVSNMLGPLMGIIQGGSPTCLNLVSVPYEGNGGPVPTTETNYGAANIQGEFNYVSNN